MKSRYRYAETVMQFLISERIHLVFLAVSLKHCEVLTIFDLRYLGHYPSSYNDKRVLPGSWGWGKTPGDDLTKSR
ncbi:MAG: hypothetical protein BroJett011_59720 [Chloroflexota bacterium]|nr:MAG: hypothetical protein BroJett011_59720 [Chloroflexota bacterium]